MAIHCKGHTDIEHHIVGEVSPFFSAALHEGRHPSAERCMDRPTHLALWCRRLNLSIHDRYEVQAALDRGDDMQQFAQGIIRRGCR